MNDNDFAKDSPAQFDAGPSQNQKPLVGSRRNFSEGPVFDEEFKRYVCDIRLPDGRRLKRRRTHDFSWFSDAVIDLSRLCQFRQAEVENFYQTIGSDHHVLWLDVTVNDPGAVGSH